MWGRHEYPHFREKETKFQLEPYNSKWENWDSYPRLPEPECYGTKERWKMRRWLSIETYVEFMTRQWFFSWAQYLGHLKSCSALTPLGIVNDVAPAKPAEQEVGALGMGWGGQLLHHKELKPCGVQCGHVCPQWTSSLVRECTVLFSRLFISTGWGGRGRKVLWTECSCPLKIQMLKS